MSDLDWVQVAVAAIPGVLALAGVAIKVVVDGRESAKRTTIAQENVTMRGFQALTDNLQEEIARLHEQVQALQEAQSQERRTNDELRTQISRLRYQINVLEHRIEQLEKQRSNLRDENERLRETIRQLKTKLGHYEQVLDGIERDMCEGE